MKQNESRLTFIKEVKHYDSYGWRRRKALYRCSCGKQKEILCSSVEKGDTKSCGCYLKEASKSRSTVHGLRNTKIYNTWKNMKSRCLNKNASFYYRYGGRGISVCDEWKNDFRKFYDWSIQNGYKEGLTIDRIDNDGNYEPSNCRWITIEENSSRINKNGINKETVKIIRSVDLSTKDLSDIYDCSPGTINSIRNYKTWKNVI